MIARLRTPLAIVALFAGLTVAMTWPQAPHLGTHVPPHDDPLLSIWRIAWIAHALATSPASLMNGNIFHPELRTLAFTDGVPLQGLAGAPFITAGASPVTVYNVIILASIALSGVTMCLLARRLTGSLAAGIVAGVIFAFVPYRFDHYMHLELQATVFLPLALWFLDRALDHGRTRDVAGFGAAMVLQVLSSIYYAVFLATALAVAIPVALLRVDPARRRGLLLRLAAVTVVSAIVISPYLLVYVQNRHSVGERTTDQVEMYSATLGNYLATDPLSLIHGGWSADLGRAERRLFPGVLAIGLAGVGLYGWNRRKTMLAVVGGVGFVLSLGINTPLYDLLREVVFAYRGLRAPARAAVLVCFAVAAFAAYGWAAILSRRPRWRVPATAALVVLLSFEYLHTPPAWLILPREPSSLSQWLASQPRSVVVEFPLPTADKLHTIYDGLYMYASTFHWQPMLNGYSGFHPQSYIELIEEMRAFPSAHAINYLKRRRVDVIVLHGSYLEPDVLGAWATALSARNDVQLVAEFPEQRGADLVFRVRREP